MILVSHKVRVGVTGANVLCVDNHFSAPPLRVHSVEVVGSDSMDVAILGADSPVETGEEVTGIVHNSVVGGNAPIWLHVYEKPITVSQEETLKGTHLVDGVSRYLVTTGDSVVLAPSKALVIWAKANRAADLFCNMTLETI